MFNGFSTQVHSIRDVHGGHGVFRMSYFSQLSERKQQNEALAQKAVEIAVAKGADQAKVSVFAGKGIEVTSRHCDIDLISFNQDQNMSIVVYKDHCTGSASTSDLSIESITAAVDAALGLCKYTSADECAGLCDLDVMFRPQSSDKQLETVFKLPEDIDAITADVLKLERLGVEAAKDNPLLKGTDECGCENAYSVETMATSQGFLSSSISSRSEKYLVMVGEKDGVMQRSSGFTCSLDANKLRSDERIVSEAVQRTVDKLGGRTVPTGVYPVILTPDTAISLFGHFKDAIGGYAIYRKSSFLVDYLNKSVFPEFLQIKEDPWNDKFFGASLFDGDAVASRPLDIVKNGVLKEYLLGTYSARKLNMRCNGHNSVSYPWFVTADEAHTRSFDDLLKEVGTGLVINSLIGQGVSVVSGNYSRGAAGYFFKDGQRQYAVDGITIAGNLKDMFSKIALVGNDTDERYRIQVGSVFLPDMTISGTNE